MIPRELLTAGTLKKCISFIDTERLMVDEDRETSKLNRGEASCILFLVNKLIREGIPAAKILVISPYKAQGEGCSNWNHTNPFDFGFTIQLNLT